MIAREDNWRWWYFDSANGQVTTIVLADRKGQVIGRKAGRTSLKYLAVSRVKRNSGINV
jgi:hypothetical protein